LGDLCAEGVTSVKLYLAYPERLMVDDGTVLRMLQAAGRLGALLTVHCENGGAIELLRAQAAAAGRREARAHADTRPPEAEGEAVWRVAMLAEMAGAPVYAVHLSSSHALASLRRARERGLPVFGETCPQYLWLDASLYDRDDGYRFVCAPPLRDRGHQEELWEGLARGDLQAVATDHCPFWRRDKAAAKEFRTIPGGLPGVETRMSLVYQGVREGRLRLEQWVDLCATAPAKLFGLWPRKGQLRAGADADVVVFDPAREHGLSAGALHMETDDSPYEGQAVVGWPAMVWLRGQLVADGGRFVGAPAGGRYVARSLPVLDRA
jgi:dihydropyrimidinase